MAMAFGIEYGLEDIRRANAAITRELEQQLAITQRLASEARQAGVGGQPAAFSLGSGATAASNVVSVRGAEERRVNDLIDRRIRSENGRWAGMSTVRGMSAAGRFSAIRGVSELIQGGGSVESTIQGLRLGADAFRGTSLGGLLAGAAPFLGVAAVGAPFVLGLADQVRAAFTGQTAKEYGEALKRAGAIARTALPAEITQPNADQFIRDLIENEKSLAPGLQAGGFAEALQAQAGLAGDLANRVGAFTKNPALVARLLNEDRVENRGFQNERKIWSDAGTMSGLNRRIRGTGKDVATAFMALAKTGQARQWIDYVEGRMKLIELRERAQAELFEQDPMLASKYHERQRAQKWEEEQRAKKLQDWSRS